MYHNIDASCDYLILCLYFSLNSEPVSASMQKRVFFFSVCEKLIR